MEEAQIFTLEDAKKIFEQDKKERGEKFLSEMNALIKKYNCDIIPVTNISGQQIDASTLLKGELAFRIQVNEI